MTDEPIKILDFFVAARRSRMAFVRDGRVSPSVEHPKFVDLYSSVNKPLGDFNSYHSSDPNYSPEDDGPSAA